MVAVDFLRVIDLSAQAIVGYIALEYQAKYLTMICIILETLLERMGDPSCGAAC